MFSTKIRSRSTLKILENVTLNWMEHTYESQYVFEMHYKWMANVHGMLVESEVAILPSHPTQNFSWKISKFNRMKTNPTQPPQSHINQLKFGWRPQIGFVRNHLGT